MNTQIYIGLFLLVSGIVVSTLLYVMSEKGIMFHDINVMGFQSSAQTWICLLFTMSFAFLSIGYHKEHKKFNDDVADEFIIDDTDT